MTLLSFPARHWAAAPLGDLLDILDYRRVPVNAKERDARRGSVPYYGATGQVGLIDDYLFDEELVLLGEDGAPFLDALKPKAYVIRGKSWVNNHAHVLRGRAGTPAAFWKHQLDCVAYRPFVSGTTRLKLPQGPMRAIPLLVPPAGEQQRIVEAIDSYFSRLDDAVATLERAQAKLKAYRASVLKAAVEGRLVPTEAELARAEKRDYEPADVLLKRILAERRRRWEEAELAKLKASGKTPKDDKWKTKYVEPVAPDISGLPELPGGWCWATVDSFLWAIEAGKNFRCMERPPVHGEVGVVKVSAVTWGTFDENESKTCTRDELVNEAHIIRPGDFLFSRANTIELVGACVVVGNFSKRLMLSDKILRLLFAGGMERWLLWCLRSPWGRREIEALATGNQESMRNLSQESLRRIRIPVPPAQEVDRVISELERQLSAASGVSESLAQDQRLCGRLRQAILKWAFEGKLVDQDPNDEPAEKLLERIRAERAAATPTNKKPGRKPKKVPA